VSACLPSWANPKGARTRNRTTTSARNTFRYCIHSLREKIGTDEADKPRRSVRDHIRSQAAASQCSADKAKCKPPSNRLAGSASRSECIPGIEMPSECPPAFRSARAVTGTDSAKRRSARLPSAIAPVRCHLRCCASLERGRCAGHADLGIDSVVTSPFLENTPNIIMVPRVKMGATATASKALRLQRPHGICLFADLPPTPRVCTYSVTLRIFRSNQ
jgi:hypothetical protein